MTDIFNGRLLLMTGIGLVVALSSKVANADDAANCAPIFNTERVRLHASEKVDLCALTAGKPVLLVNTASHCGFTPQFKELEALHQRYGLEGLVVLGMPSDDFFQESDDQAETAEVCYKNFGVTFTMLAPAHVKGPEADSIFEAVGKQSAFPSWNFNKYLISPQGQVLHHWGSRENPLSDDITERVRKALNVESSG